MNKENAKKRAILLKRLREEHKETVARTQATFKEHKALRRQICQATRDNPRTVPEIAEETGIPSDEVLWHITAMKKYGDIAEVGTCGEYYLYQRTEEAKS